MNFGTILDSVSTTCISMLIEGQALESKKLAKNFVSYVGIKPVLKKQFYLYTQLRDVTILDKDDARLFVNECFSNLNGISFDDIKAYNAILETKFKPRKIKSSELNSAIANLIRYRSSENSVMTKREYSDYAFIVEHVMTEKQTKDVSDVISENYKSDFSHLKYFRPKHVVRFATKKFNSENKNLFSESDRRVFLALKSKDPQKIQELYTGLVKKLKDASLSLKENDKVDASLQQKIEDAISLISKSFNVDNIYNAHELLYEITKVQRM